MRSRAGAWYGLWHQPPAGPGRKAVDAAGACSRRRVRTDRGVQHQAAAAGALSALQSSFFLLLRVVGAIAVALPSCAAGSVGHQQRGSAREQVQAVGAALGPRSAPYPAPHAVGQGGAPPAPAASHELRARRSDAGRRAEHPLRQPIDDCAGAARRGRGTRGTEFRRHRNLPGSVFMCRKGRWPGRSSAGALGEAWMRCRLLQVLVSVRESCQCNALPGDAANAAPGSGHYRCSTCMP